MAKKQIATFLGPQLGLTIVGDHCLAYSGSVNVEDGTSADITMLDFRTGKYYALVDIVWTNSGISTDAFFEEVQLNGVAVYLNHYDASPDKFEKQPVPFLIPPLTHVKVLYGSGSSSAVASTVVLTGRVYE